MLNRVDKLRNRLNDDEAALISGYPNIFYYSGFNSKDAYLLISHERQYLITDSRYTIQAKQQAPDFEVIDIGIGFENIFPRISEKRIGYEESKMTVREYKRLWRKLGTHQDFIEQQKIIDEQRRIKDDAEIKKIAEAEKIGDAAFEYILPRIKAGRTEREIALELEFFMKNQGASALSFDTIAASGVRSAMPHGAASEKVIENGDFLTLDFGCVFEGYCSDMTRTVVIGKADERQKEIYSIVLEAQESALAAIEVQKSCCYVDSVARKVIADAGYGDKFGHGLGHSVGIEIHEMPSLSPKCHDIIEDGQVLTVEPGIYIEDFGGVRIEDLVVVENGIARNLTFSPKNLIEL